MAFKFNAILKFNSDQATRSMNRAGKGFARMTKSIKSASAAVGKMGQGIKGLAIAGAPAAAGVIFATKTFADFEFQMKTVQSVLLATNDEMKSLTDQAKLMGATTEFSAIQASEGQEALARSGFSTKQIMGALPGVLNAASAAGIGLGEATSIVVGQLGAFGLEASRANDVADSMALTTALTNTNFIELGEAMKFAAPELKSLGFTVAETASAIGVLANAGIKGSLAGTAIKNAFVKLSKPSKKALALLGGRAGINRELLVMTKLGPKLRPMEVIMANIAKRVKAAKDPLEAAATASEIFGLRGKAAFNSFNSALGKNIIVTEKNVARLKKGMEIGGLSVEASMLKVGDSLSSLEALRFQIAGAAGTAEQMRNIKLDSLTGQVTLLKSAFEGINIEVGEVFAGVTKNMVGTLTDGISLLTVGFQAAKNGGKATAAQLDSLNNNQFKDLIQGTIEFATGFIEGFKELKAVAIDTFNTVAEFLKPILGETGLTTKEIGKMVAKIILIGAVAAPILGGLAAAFFVLGPIITGISGMISFIGSVIGVVVGVAQVAFGLIGTAITFIGPIIGGLVTAAQIGFALISGAISFIGSVIGVLVTVAQVGFAAISAAVTFLLSPVGLVTAAVIGIGLVIAGVVENWSAVKEAFLDGDILKGFKEIGNGIMMFLSKPLDLVAEKWQGIKSFFGFGGSEDATAKGAKPFKPSNNKIEEAATIQTEALKGKALAQPPSADQISKSISETNISSSVSGGGGGGKTTQEVIVSFKGDAGNVFNKMVTKAQVDNSQRQGRTITNKRKLIQNGASI